MPSNNYGISTKSAQLIRQTLADFDTVERVTVFGSRAKGSHKEGSDIDLAIYGEHLSKETALNLSAKLNEGIPIPYFVDVVAPKFLNDPALLAHIYRVESVFYEKEHVED